MQDELRIEKEYKQLAENLLLESYEQKVRDGKAGGSKIGERLADYSFNTVKDNIKALFESEPHRGVVPAYQEVVNKLLSTYKGNEDELYTLLTMSVFNVLTSNALKHQYLGVSISYTADKLYFAILEEVQAFAFLHQYQAGAGEEKDTNEYKKWFNNGLRKRSAQRYKETYARFFYKNRSWTPPTGDKINGIKLCCKLIELCVVGSGYFEYCKVERNKKQAVVGIKPKQWLLDTWNKNIDLLQVHAHKYCPMVVKPKDWVSPWEGAYYGDIARFCKFIRVDFYQSNSFLNDYQKRLNQLYLSWLYQVLNAVQGTAYIINKPVLDVAMSISNGNGGLGGIPDTKPMPEMPKLINPTEEELEQRKAEMGRKYRADRARQSRILRINMTLGTAKNYVGYEEIYFPWNMDYRGRLYPMPTEISPQGDDLQRGLLLFAAPEPIKGNKTLDWFYIAGAGYAGVDKVSFADRIKWVKDNKENIIQTAKDPLGYTWWSEVAGDEHPFIFLAWCFEYVKLQEYIKEHGDAIGFKTGIPICFDGTCSGLQHFSALLADEVGGQAVNLIPQDTVQDIYQIVADKITPVLHKDALEGTNDDFKVDKKGIVVKDKQGNKRIKYGTKELASEWLSFCEARFGVDYVPRKICKRSVMTLAYGSGRYGFAENLKHDLMQPWQQAHDNDNPIFLDIMQASTYMAQLIWDAVSCTVVKAVEGMKWLQEIAELICKNNNVVQWLSPNGLPIQQNKYVDNTISFRMRFSNFVKTVYMRDTPTEIDNRRQAQSIAPNFIHSMDACHMQRVIHNQAEKGNTNFMMIHDSFGTDLAHAADLFTSIRSEMVEMYQDHNYLQEFLDGISFLLPEQAEIPKIPEKGSLDISSIKNSKYCFS